MECVEASFEARIGQDEGKALMVDIGGGLAHDLMGMAAGYPDKKMRLVVQDLSSVIAETKEQQLGPRIEMVEHDFFTGQPVQHAKIASCPAFLMRSFVKLTVVVLF